MGQENDGAERCNKQGRKFKHDTNLTTDLRPVTLLKAQRFRLISARQENGFVARPLARPEDRGTVFRTRTTTIGLAVAEPRSVANHVAALVAPVPIEDQPGQARPQRATQQCPPNNDLDSERHGCLSRFSSPQHQRSKAVSGPMLRTRSPYDGTPDNWA